MLFINKEDFNRKKVNNTVRIAIVKLCIFVKENGLCINDALGVIPFFALDSKKRFEFETILFLIGYKPSSEFSFLVFNGLEKCNTLITFK